MGNVLLDFLGGSMDICQIILQGANTGILMEFFLEIIILNLNNSAINYLLYSHLYFLLQMTGASLRGILLNLGLDVSQCFSI